MFEARINRTVFDKDENATGKIFYGEQKNAKNKEIIEFVNELTFTHTK